MRFLIVLSVLLLFLITSLQGETLTLLSEYNHPFSFQAENPRRGISIDLLREMLKIIQREEAIEDIQFIPWARAYLIAQNEKNTLLFPMARTEEREELFHWVGPIYQMEIGLVAKNNRNIHISNTDDLSEYSIGTVRDGAPEQLLLAEEVGMDNLERVTSIEQNLKMLFLDRVDLVAYNIPSTLYYLKEMGEELSEYDVVFILKNVELHYAFHKNTDEKIIADLQSALDSLVADGRYDEIVESYLGQ